MKLKHILAVSSSLVLTFGLLLYFIDIRLAQHTVDIYNAVKNNLDVPDTFGKTHFIVGYTQEASDVVVDEKNDLQKTPAAKETPATIIDRLTHSATIKHVFFAPDDDIQELILYLIGIEKKAIKIAAFAFTDGKIAQALVDAYERGVDVQMIVDPKCVKDEFNKIEILQNNGMAIFVYDPQYDKKKKGLISSLMHHKIMLFFDNINSKTILITGSLNLTKSAHERNQENIIVLDDPDIVSKYITHYEVLKKRSNKVTNR